AGAAFTIPYEVRCRAGSSLSVASNDANLSKGSSSDNHKLDDGSPFYENKLRERSPIEKEEIVERRESKENPNNANPGKPETTTKNGKNGKAPSKHDWSRKGQPGQKVFWTPSATRQLDILGLHGKDRKAVKKFHVNAVKKAMAQIPGATSAKIFRLAHKNTSPDDKKMHITGKFYADGNVLIPSTYKPTNSDKQLEAQYHHIYTPSNDPEKLPTAFKNAVINQGKTLDQL
ncbi:hypothetical protein H0H92_005887, partial [Tricholoma furcatifolium]